MYRAKAGRLRINNAGYVVVPATIIADNDLPTFRLMQGKGGYVLQHRWNMAKALGRPLRSDEAVDHMDGNKVNNDLSNLRLYVVGKNQPGSLNGHGTYYHEWQMAELRCRMLQAEIGRLRSG